MNGRVRVRYRIKSGLARFLRSHPNVAIRIYRILVEAEPIKTVSVHYRFDPRRFGMANSEEGAWLELFFPARDTSLLLPTLNQQPWEPDEVQFVVDHMSPHTPYNLFDVGANVGLFSIQCDLLRRCHSNTLTFRNIFLFEPVQHVHECLSLNVQKAGLARARCFKVALSDHEGEEDILLDANNIGNNSFLEQSMRFGIYDRERVAKRRLSDLMRPHDLAPEDPAILKLDVQGYEPRVVKGIGDDLWNAIRIAVIELSPPVMAAHGDKLIDEFLTRLSGFTEYFVTCDGVIRKIRFDELRVLARDPTRRYFNAFFVR